jgi:hypothetical protein
MKPNLPAQKIAVVVKFHPATNTNGSRIGLSLPRFDNKRKAIPFNHAFNDTTDGALDWLASKGVNPEAVLDMGSHYAFVCDWAQRPALFAAFGIPERY